MARRQALKAEPAWAQIEAVAALGPGQGWLVHGTTTAAWSEHEPPERLVGNLTLGDVTGEAVTAFLRPDGAPDSTPDSTLAFCTILAAPRPERAQLTALSVPHLRLRAPVPPAAHSPLDALARRVRRAVRDAGLDEHPILSLLPVPAFEGVDTLGRLFPPIRLELDQTIRVRPDGLALAGWLLDPANAVRALRVHGAAVATLPRERMLWLRRPDIAGSAGKSYAIEDDRLGFLAYAPAVAAEGAQPYIEIETNDGEIGYKTLRVLEIDGLGAIKQFLSVPTPPSFALQAAFDHVLGPIADGLNRSRLARPRRQAQRHYGGPPQDPRISLIITIHGRLDLVELQLALFSERPDPAVELILVLDDPTLQEEADRLFVSLWTRFRLPFLAILLAENLGYAPANNAGLAAARGSFVCLLNSDVFPMPGEGLAWAEPLAAQLEHDQTLAAVGPLLLFEDGTVQHRGMHDETTPMTGPWLFPIHTGKAGLPPPPAPLDATALTGACLMLRRADLEASGGLDERYLIGDFEDADLCRQLCATGRTCRVDAGVRLYHLERQSQGDTKTWRANVTLFNAWQFWRRWNDAP